MEPNFRSLRSRCVIFGAVALGLCGLGGLADPRQFFASYLLGWVFWASVALGCLPIVMLQHLTGGAWGLVLRRILEAAVGTLPGVAVSFLPVVLGSEQLYLWARPEAVAADPILQEKAPYLNVSFFALRSVAYFAIWIGVGTALLRWSAQQDETGDVVLARRMQVFSGPGLLACGLATTFASVDWLMSLEPHWYSTIFGMWFFASQGLAAFAFAVALLVGLSDRPPLASVLRPGIFHDLGKLLLAFVMVWAYLSFSQFLIIFSGNLPEEIPYYLDRSRGGWQWVAAAIVVFHFALPFVLLLSRDLKRDARRLALVALLVFAMRFVDLLWLVVPVFHSEGLGLHWMDLLLPLGLGGLWLAAFFARLEKRPLLPLHDPYAEETLAHAAEH
jgi:hypothetical protein